MKRSHVAFLAIGVVVFAGVAYAALSPYLTARSIEKAVAEGNGDALLEHVDVESVEANLKPLFERELAQAIATNNQGSDLLLLGEAMGPIMVDRFAWEYSHRDALVQTMLSGKPTKRSNLSALSGEPVSLTTRYAGLNRFEVSTQTNQPVTLVLSRRGLGWKVTSLSFTP